MSITIDLPPTMAQEVRDYATVQGTTLERMFLDYLAAELKRRREADEVMSRLDELAKKTGARLTGEAYKFNRADAYEPETVYA
ncbi:MAG: hypothetical protein IJL17_01815 [Kiritimatiellae bacterium]|nr:hypothetical protein [Kiritimatiellia bacterium]